MKPLDGVKVLDLSHALAGPYCTYQLMLLGAEIVKVENPKVGDDFRGFAPPIFDAVNAGKQSIVLDLKKPGALAVLARLARDADVLVDNFKPGTAAKFGITWDVVQGWNPRLTWCSISGFGLQGPWRDLPAVEWSVQGASGLTDSYLDSDSHPEEMGLGVLDLSAGNMAATAILAAMLKTARTQRGERLDVAMLDVALSLSAPRVTSATPGGKRERRPGVGRYQAKDRPLFVMGAHQRWFETIANVLGEPLLHKDPRFADPKARLANGEALRVVLDERLAARNAEEWEKLFTDAGMPAAAVRTTQETLNSPHMKQRGMVSEVAVAGATRSVQVVGTAYQMGGVTLNATGPVPALGAATDSVLTKAGFSMSEIEQLRKAELI